MRNGSRKETQAHGTKRSILLVAAVSSVLLTGFSPTVIGQTNEAGAADTLVLTLTPEQQQAVDEAIAAAQQLAGDERALTELVFQVVMRFPAVGPALVTGLVQSSDSFSSSPNLVAAVVRGAVLANPANAGAVVGATQGLVPADVQEAAQAAATQAQAEGSVASTTLNEDVEEDEVEPVGDGEQPPESPPPVTPPPAQESAPSPS